MTRTEMMDTISQLATKHVFYAILEGELKESEANGDGRYERFMEELERKHFENPIDMILWMECSEGDT